MSFRESLVEAWFLPRLTALTAALTPLALVFGLLARARRACYRAGLLRTQNVGVPVVVVGNISVGGTGKTPLVIALARAAVSLGYTPAIVSRGYGGARGRPRRVSVRDDARLVGDEPLLLAALGFPVWTARDRVAAARELVAAHPRVDLLISDDGLQHYRLAREVEIAVVDAQRHFGNHWLLPAGPLREPVSRLEEVTAVVWNGVSVTAAGIPGQFGMRLRGKLFRNLVERDCRARATDFKGSRVHAVAGIGNPQRFFSHLCSLGLEPVCHAFPDHHAFTPGDLELPDADAILMTEKDAVKCRAFADARAWALPVSAEISTALVDLIAEKLSGSQAAGNTRVSDHQGPADLR